MKVTSFTFRLESLVYIIKTYLMRTVYLLTISIVRI